MAKGSAAQDFSDALLEVYSKYKEPSLHFQRVRHRDVVPLLQQFAQNPLFDLREIGKSVQGREIYSVTVGKGPVNVLMWSQMHGNEATATMALFDMFHFFKDEEAFPEFKKALLEKVTLTFIPMLNPDGAEVHERRNALGIDLNRDALHLQAPESRLLKQMRDKLDADFGFNLHDQNSLWSAGKSNQPASVSFLATAFNEAKEINEVREKSMKLIISLNRILQKYIPGRIGKFNDDFEPRAFGDNIQKWGTSLVLIESGGNRKDPERQEVRKMNFVAILSALKAIIEEDYLQNKLEDYYAIPNNEESLFHLLIRNATVNKEDGSYTMDIGINHESDHEAEELPLKFTASIEDLGDLSTFYGYEEIDASGMTVVPGKVYPRPLHSWKEAQQIDFNELLKAGYLFVKVHQLERDKSFTNVPINWIAYQRPLPPIDITLGSTANFLLVKQGSPCYAIVNGFIYDLTQGRNEILNGVIYKG
ncbi:M14 family zinc carboxypeptidase [Rapidithrix thailandica]|uniref:M14 family zinc carboxypeptidase n=1 Tax=Rapidithrix thailandica TaxID=413964 RepID=A0AAW9S4B2_9BACT